MIQLYHVRQIIRNLVHVHQEVIFHDVLQNIGNIVVVGMLVVVFLHKLHLLQTAKGQGIQLFVKALFLRLFGNGIIGKQPVDGDTEIVGDGRQQFHVRVAYSKLPAGHGLVGYAEDVRQDLLCNLFLLAECF